jgi:hypothetical protein
MSFRKLLRVQLAWRIFTRLKDAAIVEASYRVIVLLIDIACESHGQNDAN